MAAAAVGAVIYNICEDWSLDFVGMFACTGLWNAFFLFIYAVTDASKLMKWCTRSAATSAYLLILQGTVPGARRRGRSSGRWPTSATA